MAYLVFRNVTKSQSPQRFLIVNLIEFHVFYQVKTTDADINNEVAVAGPSGDSEIREDEERRGNEVGHGKGASDVGVEPDLTGNTIDTGSSAAQLPQKNILERKEVLIGKKRM